VRFELLSTGDQLFVDVDESNAAPGAAESFGNPRQRPGACCGSDRVAAA
jgi:hypothetical protein